MCGMIHLNKRLPLNQSVILFPLQHDVVQCMNRVSIYEVGNLITLKYGFGVELLFKYMVFVVYSVDFIHKIHKLSGIFHYKRDTLFYMSHHGKP